MEKLIIIAIVLLAVALSIRYFSKCLLRAESRCLSCCGDCGGVCNRGK